MKEQTRLQWIEGISYAGMLLSLPPIGFYVARYKITFALILAIMFVVFQEIYLGANAELNRRYLND